MILMNLTAIGWEVHLAQDGDQWQTLLKMVVYLHVLQYDEIFLTKITVTWPNRTVLHGVKLLTSSSDLLSIGTSTSHYVTVMVIYLYNYLCI